MRLPEEGLWGDHHSLPEAHYPQTPSLFTPEAPPGTKSQKLGGLRAQYPLAENHMEWPPKVTHPEWQSWCDQPSWSAPAGTGGFSGMRGFRSLKGDSPRQCGVLGLAPGDPNFSSPSTPQIGEEKKAQGENPEPPGTRRPSLGLPSPPPQCSCGQAGLGGLRAALGLRAAGRGAGTLCRTKRPGRGSFEKSKEVDLGRGPSSDEEGGREGGRAAGGRARGAGGGRSPRLACLHGKRAAGWAAGRCAPSRRPRGPSPRRAASAAGAPARLRHRVPLPRAARREAIGRCPPGTRRLPLGVARPPSSLRPGPPEASEPGP